MTMTAGESEDHSGLVPPPGANEKPPTQTGPEPGGAAAVSRLVAAERAARELPAGRGHAREAILAGGLHQRRLAKGGQREAVAIGLLQAEVAVARAARGKHRGGEVDLGGHGRGDGGEHPAAPAARGRDRPLHPRLQLGPRAIAEPQRALYGV